MEEVKEEKKIIEETDNFITIHIELPKEGVDILNTVHGQDIIKIFRNFLGVKVVGGFIYSPKKDENKVTRRFNVFLNR